ncbi:MAG: M56 family metallopeptidase [Chthoniobacterales bacterium]|nr:M56 family metallopeptidase [Chthoniobacterales bacterium]
MTPFILSLAVKLTALLIAGGLVTVALRHSTYAVRHIVIAATLACVVALPAAMILVPEWRVAVLPSAPTTIESVVTSTPVAKSQSIHPVLVTSSLAPSIAPAPGFASQVIDGIVRLTLAPRALSAPQMILVVWLLGVFIGLAWIALGRIGLARVRRNATALTTYEWRTILEAEAMHAGVARRVALFTSPSVSMPVTWGVLSPVIVLPEAALAWAPDRKRVVVMHEMAHIARRDSATQLVATLACVAYWLHPLVLLAARRLRAECERACDERVLERGTPAAEYAAHLLDVAKFSRSFGASSIVSVAMARPSQLEGRLLAVLRAEPRRARTTTRTRVLAAMTAAAMLMIVSAFKPVVREVQTRTTVRTTIAVAPPMLVVHQASRAPQPARVALVAPVALSASIARSHPDSTFSKSVPAKSGGTLDLDLDAGGDIDIAGTDDSKITVSGSLGGRDWRDVTVDLDAHGDGAQLTARYVGRSDTQQFDNAFTIRVPKHFNLRIHSAGGSVIINGVDGRLTGETGGGKMEISHASGYANLSTGGGNVRVSNSHLDGSVATGGGTVDLDQVTGSLVGASGSSARTNGNFDFRWPAFSKMPALAELPNIPEIPPIPEIDQETMKQTMKALKRAQRTMERARASSQSDYADADDASDAAEMSRDAAETSRNAAELSRESMGRARIAMKLNRVLADSMRIMIRRNLGDLDSTIVIDQGGGSIHVLRARKGARLRTGGGNISIDEADGDATARTGGGDITVTAGKGKAHAVDVSSGNGNVDVVIPRGADVTLDLETAYTQNFGKHTQIKGDYPLEQTETPDWDSTHGTPRKYVRVKQKIGKGGALIRVRTVNGDIRLSEGN